MNSLERSEASPNTLTKSSARQFPRRMLERLSQLKAATTSQQNRGTHLSLTKVIFGGLLFSASAFGADVPISSLPAASSVTGADVVPIVQSGTTKKSTFTVQKGLWDTFYQPLDGDLTAISALSGTHTIYYRSAASTWSAVTVGSGLNFTGATLAVNTPTPTPTATATATATPTPTPTPTATPEHHTVTAYAAGTVYSLTNTDALVDFGTTDPTIVVDQAGTYLLFGRAYLIYNGATYAGTQTATIHLRRTNNTPADVANATTTATLRIVTTITDTVGVMPLPPVVYTTSNSNDSISVYGSLSATPAAGSVDVKEASILALRIL